MYGFRLAQRVGNLQLAEFFVPFLHSPLSTDESVQLCDVFLWKIRKELITQLK
jgi:hypothetical protein